MTTTPAHVLSAPPPASGCMGAFKGRFAAFLTRMLTGVFLCTFLTLLPSGAAHALMPEGVKLKITGVENVGFGCADFKLTYQYTGLDPNVRTRKGMQYRLQQGGRSLVTANPQQGLDNWILPDDSGQETYSRYIGVTPEVCSFLEDAPFTISLLWGEVQSGVYYLHPDLAQFESEPVEVSGLNAPTMWRLPSPANISVSGESCADARLHLDLDGLAPSETNVFSRLDVTLRQGSTTVELTLPDWNVAADDSGKAVGEVAFSDLTNVNVWSVKPPVCEDLAAGTPFDVTATAAMVTGESWNGSTSHAWTPSSSTDDPMPPTDDPVPPTDDPVPPTDDPVPPTDDPVPPTDDPEPSPNPGFSFGGLLLGLLGLAWGLLRGLVLWLLL